MVASGRGAVATAVRAEKARAWVGGEGERPAGSGLMCAVLFLRWFFS